MYKRVVFLHGVLMIGAEMSLLRRRVAQAGFRVTQFRYDTRARNPVEHAEDLARVLKTIDADEVHLVGHSLGGIVLLHLFRQSVEFPPGRVVLLGAPVNGSETARRLAKYGLFRWLLGRSLDQGLLGELPRFRVDRETLVIAGTQGVGVGRILAYGSLPHPNDGTVALSETKVGNGAVELCLPASHTGMLVSRPVASAVSRFLSTGEVG